MAFQDTVGAPLPRGKSGHLKGIGPAPIKSNRAPDGAVQETEQGNLFLVALLGFLTRFPCSVSPSCRKPSSRRAQVAEMGTSTAMVILPGSVFALV